MPFTPSPVIAVARHGDFGRAVARARVLRDRSDTIAEFDPADGQAGLDELVPLVQGFGAETPLHLVFLVGDLDGTIANADLLVDEAAAFETQLKDRFPLLRIRIWFVLRTGRKVGAEEFDLASAAAAKRRNLPVVASLVLTESSGASHSHPVDDIDRQIGDLLHIISVTEFDALASATDARIWAVGIGSVVYRPDGLVNSIVRATDDSLERLLNGGVRDPSYDQGTRWVADRNLAPPRPGEDRDDSELRALLAGPARGSLADDPGRELRRLNAELDAVDPGLWAGMIAAEVDIAAAPRTDPNAPDRSPLVVALDHVNANAAARLVELRSDLEAEARRVLEEQGSVSSAGAWCEGARAAIQGAIEEVHADVGEDEPIDLASDYTRLSKLACRLPYSASVLVRGLLLVVLLLVLGYVYAPVGSFVAWAFSKRVLFFGDTVEDNARMWARITAAGAGVIVWLWWEAKWRRIRRYRRRYVRHAEEQLRGMVEEAARQGRVGLLQDLLDFVGTPEGPAGSLRAWLTTTATALAGLRGGAAEDHEASDLLPESPWTAVIPSQDDPSRLLESLSESSKADLVRKPLEAILASALDASVEDVLASMRASIDDELPGTSRDLHGHWSEVDAIGESARAALTAPLYAGLAAEVSERHGSSQSNQLVAPPSASRVIEQVGAFGSTLACNDPNFAANMWTTLVVEAPDPTTPAAGGAGS